MTTITDLERIREQALAALAGVETVEAVEGWRIAHLGRTGTLTRVLRSIGSLSVEERRQLGAAGNGVKRALEDALNAKLAELRAAQLDALAGDALDVTLPGRAAPLGRYHPSTRIIRDICAIFQQMGFQVVEGPEVEWDRYNFELLNIPKDHPARDMFDTFWVEANRDASGDFSMLLRTHTSPMQARIMEGQQPPVRVIVPGKVYRYEATDATHESQFHQIEGLVVDKGISLANLKHTVHEFARQLFGEGRKVRFRCDYFPFVEPGVDVAVDCFKCEGGEPSCRVCRGSGWLEIMGAGMVHPEVLRGVGYDPDIYTGFAFGMGPERIAMLKYGIEDIRLFLANDIRFLRQF